MNEKSKPNYFKLVIYVFIVVYMALYFLDSSGYYQKRRDKVEFTSAQIERFEEDVNSGKNVSINSYLEDTNKDYSNSFSKTGYFISTIVDKTFKKLVNGILALASKFVS